MVRIRCATQAYAEIKEADPRTAITERQVRSVINSGKIPIVKNGNRKMVDMDVLVDYFRRPEFYDKK